MKDSHTCKTLQSLEDFNLSEFSINQSMNHQYFFFSSELSQSTNNSELPSLIYFFDDTLILFTARSPSGLVTLRLNLKLTGEMLTTDRFGSFSTRTNSGPKKFCSYK